MKVLILSSGVGRGGRGKALLSLSAYLSREFDISVVSDRLNKSDGGGFSIDYLVSHHAIYPDVNWEYVEWDEEEPEDVFDGYSPDVAIGFDSAANSYLHRFDVPTIAYCRRGISDWADEYWTPSRKASNKHNAWLREHELGDNCHAVYPIWYIREPDSVKPFDEREIDVLVHDRKAEGVDLSDYDSYYASGHPWDELTEIYENSKVFLFPTKPRFEPLGLMPLEAANYGCHLSLPRNAGVSEIYPHSVYRRPEEAIDQLLDEDGVSDLSIPESPTDPIERIRLLTEDAPVTI